MFRILLPSTFGQGLAWSFPTTAIPFNRNCSPIDKGAKYTMELDLIYSGYRVAPHKWVIIHILPVVIAVVEG